MHLIAGLLVGPGGFGPNSFWPPCSFTGIKKMPNHQISAVLRNVQKACRINKGMLKMSFGSDLSKVLKLTGIVVHSVYVDEEII